MNQETKPPLTVVKPNGSAAPAPMEIKMIIYPDGKMDITGPFDKKDVFIRILAAAITTVTSYEPPPVSPWDKTKNFLRGKH